MSSRDALIGGAVEQRRSRRVAKPDQRPEPVPAVGLGFLATILAIGAVMTACGLLKVHAVFAARDYEIEARRLQEQVAEKRDRFKVLNSRLSSLQRMEVLRGAGLDNLGMMEPQPMSMKTLVVSADAARRWQMAATRAERSLRSGKEDEMTPGAP